MMGKAQGWCLACFRLYPFLFRQGPQSMGWCCLSQGGSSLCNLTSVETPSHTHTQRGIFWVNLGPIKLTMSINRHRWYVSFRSALWSDQEYWFVRQKRLRFGLRFQGNQEFLSELAWFCCFGPVSRLSITETVGGGISLLDMADRKWLGETQRGRGQRPHVPFKGTPNGITSCTRLHLLKILPLPTSTKIL